MAGVKADLGILLFILISGLVISSRGQEFEIPMFGTGGR